MWRWDITAVKKMKKSVMLLILSVVFLLPSCMVTKTNVKNYADLEGQEYYYAKGRHMYLFWGLLPVGKPAITQPVEIEPCQVRTSTEFVDGLVSTITGGIFSMQTVGVLAKRTEPLKVGDAVNYYKGEEVMKGKLETIIDNKKCIVLTADNKPKKMNLKNVWKAK